MKSLLLVDASNLFHCVSSKFPGRKLDYKRLIKEVDSPFRSIVYGAQMESEADNFIKTVRGYGYNVKFKRPKTYDNVRKANWDVGITVDAMRYLNNVTSLVLCTADGDFKPLVDWYIDNGKTVLVYGCNISRDLKDSCTLWTEITSEWLC